MSKFLDKKEQVIDFKLTSYGHYLLSIGNFKPTYYTFLDDNVVYDSAYYGRTGEAQNEIHKRIKQDTQYLESLVLFEEVGKNKTPLTDLNHFNLTPEQKNVRIDEFKYNSIIGDSFVADNKQKVPSWKLVSLRSDISSSSVVDQQNGTRIPQINITASYQKRIMDSQDFANMTFNTSTEAVLEAVSNTFSDNKVVYLEMKDVVVYLEEVNTEILNENFDIEIFEIEKGTPTTGEALTRKYFQNKKEQIVDGLMVSANEQPTNTEEMTTDAVENYFYVFTDREVDEETACKLANAFNKESYYIDLDFDCEKEIDEDLFFDIYGSESEAEICQT